MEKGFAHLLFLIIIVVGIAFGVYLSQNPQIFDSHASNISRVEVIDDNGNVLTTTNTPNVKVRITYVPPLSFHLIPEALAASSLNQCIYGKLDQATITFLNNNTGKTGNVDTIVNKQCSIDPKKCSSLRAQCGGGGGGGGGQPAAATFNGQIRSCKNEVKTWSQIDDELKGAGYSGPFNHSAIEMSAYNRAACPAGFNVTAKLCGKTETWGQFDAELRGANYPGPFDHNVTEAKAYVNASCAGKSFTSTAYDPNLAPTAFRIANDPTSLLTAPEQPFDGSGQIVDWSLSSGDGNKSFYVQLKVNNAWNFLMAGSVVLDSTAASSTIEPSSASVPLTNPSAPPDINNQSTSQGFSLNQTPGVAPVSSLSPTVNIPGLTPTGLPTGSSQSTNPSLSLPATPQVLQPPVALPQSSPQASLPLNYSQTPVTTTTDIPFVSGTIDTISNINDSILKGFGQLTGIGR